MTKTFGKKGVKPVAVAPKLSTTRAEPSIHIKSDAEHNMAVLKGYALSLLPVAGLIVAGLFGFAVLAAGLSPSAEEQWVESVKAEVTARMRDPDSVRFTNISISDGFDEGSRYLTGCVKGRNGFGGYSEWQKFSVYKSTHGAVGSVDIGGSC